MVGVIEDVTGKINILNKMEDFDQKFPSSLVSWYPTVSIFTVLI